MGSDPLTLAADLIDEAATILTAALGPAIGLATLVELADERRAIEMEEA